MAANTIDLSRLPPPDVVEQLSFEQVLADAKAFVIERAPEMEPVLALESEPAVKVLEVLAYYVVLCLNRANQSAKAVMPALAVGSDLDHVAAIVGVSRLLIDEGDPAQGVAPTWEDDESFRRRMVMAPVGFSVAGPAEAYVFHALSASGEVLDASAWSPDPGEVVVAVLARQGDGTASPELVDTVQSRLSADDVRPLTDHVTVQSAEVVRFQVKADVPSWPGPDPAVVEAAARTRLDALLAQARRLGHGVARASLIAALHAEGARNVVLHEPQADLDLTSAQAASCQLIRLNGERGPAGAAAVGAMVVPPSGDRAAAVDDLIARLMVEDVWPFLSGLWIMGAHYEQAARVNLRGPGLNDLTAVNSPAFAADSGFTGDGMTSWLDTGLTPDVLQGADAGSVSMGAWLATNPSPGTSQFPLGVIGGDEVLSMAISPSTGNFSGRVGTTDLAAFGSAATTTGHFAVSRTSPTHVRGFHNGALVSEQPSPFVTLAGGGSIGLGRRLSSYHSGTLKAAWLGHGLSSSRMAALHAALSAYFAEAGA